MLILIIMLAIPVGVKLAQERQQIHSQAAGTGNIIFSGTTVTKDQTNNYVTTSPTVQVQVVSPFGVQGN